MHDPYMHCHYMSQERTRDQYQAKRAVSSKDMLIHDVEVYYKILYGGDKRYSNIRREI
jgi:hypothetical protein